MLSMLKRVKTSDHKCQHISQVVYILFMDFKLSNKVGSNIRIDLPLFHPHPHPYLTLQVASAVLASS